MVQITLLEVDLADAEFNAPFAGSGGDEPVRGLKSAISDYRRSMRGESEEETYETGSAGTEDASPGNGLAVVGAFLFLLALGWLVRRSRRRASVDEVAVEST